MTLILPLDFQTLFVNTFAGSMMIFIGIALLVIGGMAARFRMPNVIFGSMVALFGILFMSWAGWLYVSVIVILGLIIGYAFARLVKS